MNYKDNDMWDWQVQDYNLEDNTGIDVSNCLLNDVNQNEDHISHMLGDETTPIRACGDLSYHVTKNEFRSKQLEQCREAPSQVKRRRMLQFESEVLDVPPCSDEAFLRSKETQDSLEDGISEMSQWVAGFTEDVSATSNECLDPSPEGWIANCYSDEMHLGTEDIGSISGASDVQIDITDLCGTPPEYDANAVKKHPMRTHQDVVLKGKKSYMCSPPTLSSSVVYPFAFIKPCGVHGDMTLKDINRKILNPPKSRQSEEDDPSVSYPTSAFSGKPVVVKTKIHTEGGQGSITIMRTKG